MPSVTIFFGLVFFFIVMFTIFTIIPRLILNYIIILLASSKWESKSALFKHSFDLFFAYLFVGIPLTYIFYQASSFGDPKIIEDLFGKYVPVICFAVVYIILLATRFSILLKKRQFIEKIGLGSIIDLLKLKDTNRKKLREEYHSFLFDMFFVAFTLGVLIIIFKFLFLKMQTQVILPSFNLNLAEILSVVGGYVLCISLFYLTIVFFEFLLGKIGCYEIEI